MRSIFGMLITAVATTAACFPPRPQPVDPPPDPEPCDEWGECEWDDRECIGGDCVDEEEWPEEWSPPDDAPDQWVGVCLDGVYEEADGLQDCEDVSCLDEPGCCVGVERRWIEGDFDRCSDLEGCGWTVSATGSVEIEAPWVLLRDDDGGGEAGLWTEPVVELAGDSLVTFVARLASDSCSAERCPHVVGVALVRQDAPPMGVEPSVAIFLDGGQRSVHFVVAERVVHSEPIDLEALTQPMGYAFRRLSSGAVAFWSGLEVSSPDEAPTALLEGEPTFESPRSMVTGSMRHRVVVEARVSDEGEAGVAGVTLERGVCDDIDGFERWLDEPVIAPVTNARRAGRPAVVQRPEPLGGLLMVHEEDLHLVVSTSTDGQSWERVGPVGLGVGATPYGRVARRSPTVVRARAGGAAAMFHLYFEGESEYRGLGVGDPPSSAIVHAVSVDGLTWAEAPDGDSIVLVGSDEHPWRGEVGQPAVVELDYGSLLMLFVGRDPLSGGTRFGRAISTDGVNWMVDDEPLAFEDEETPTFESDGVSQPAMLRRGDVLHLWYTADSQGRERIASAVGIPVGSGRWAFTRFGLVLEAGSNWESDRVLSPTPIMMPRAGDDLWPGAATLHLYYEAGPRGEERIGLVTRDLPARLSVSGT